ncbi:MAG: ABC transporter substrate-binding protein [Bacillota bacterium]
MKKIFALLALLCTLSMLTGCGSKETATIEDDQSKPVELVWYTIGTPPKDIDEVMAKVNEYTKQKLNCTVKLIMSDDSYEQKVSTTIQSGEPIDMMFTCGWTFDYKRNATKGLFFPMNELLPKYGGDLLKTMNPLLFEGTKINGVNYAVPAAVGAVQAGWVFNNNLVGKYNFDFTGKYRLTDLIPLFQELQRDNPKLVCIRNVSWLEGREKFDYIFNSSIPGAVRVDDASCKIINQYDDPEYINIIKDARAIYTGGFTFKEKDGGDESFKAGKCAGMILGYDPLAKADDERAFKLPLVVKPAAPYALISTDTISGSMMAISATSKNPARAMKFLNLLNTDKYLRNLIGYGIEGKHYVKVSDNIIKITPLGKTNYIMASWVIGNPLITYVTEDEPANKWELMAAHLKAAKVSPAFGFAFNPEPVQNEVAAVRNVVEQYADSLRSGSVDTEPALKEFKDKLKAAGLDKMLAEMQKQVDAWKATKK